MVLSTVRSGARPAGACSKDCMPGAGLQPRVVMLSACHRAKLQGAVDPTAPALLPPLLPPCLGWVLKLQRFCLQGGDGSPLVAVKVALSAVSSKSSASDLTAYHYLHFCCQAYTMIESA